MKLLTRRNFLKYSAGTGVGLFFTPPLFGQLQSPNRSFKISLHPFAIGVNIGQEELLTRGVTYGFEAILPIPVQLAEMGAGQRSAFLEKMSPTVFHGTQQDCQLILEKTINFLKKGWPIYQNWLKRYKRAGWTGCRPGLCLQIKN